MSEKTGTHRAYVERATGHYVHEPPTRDVLYHRTRPCDGGHSSSVRVELSCGPFIHSGLDQAIANRAVTRVVCEQCVYWAAESVLRAHAAAAPAASADGLSEPTP